MVTLLCLSVQISNSNIVCQDETTGCLKNSIKCKLTFFKFLESQNLYVACYCYCIKCRTWYGYNLLKIIMHPTSDIFRHLIFSDIWYFLPSHIFRHLIFSAILYFPTSDIFCHLIFSVILYFLTSYNVWHVIHFFVLPICLDWIKQSPTDDRRKLH